MPLDLASPPEHLDAWHRLGIAFWQDEIPEVDPPGRLQALADLDSDRTLHRGALIGLDGATPVGVVNFTLPMLEDRTDAAVDVVVAPEHRRRGTGRRLLEAAAAHVSSLGRTRLLGGVKAGAPGEGFAAAVGARVTSTAVSSVLDVAKTDVTDLARLAVPDPAYRIVHWQDRCPGNLVDAFAVARTAMNDAPHGDENHDAWHWDAERVRELERRRLKWRTRCHTAAAVHLETGDVVGFTDVQIVDRPSTAMQEDTGVVAAHRGHGLGLALKAANLLTLRREEPQIAKVITWNAESNRHMRAVNETLGFHVVSTWLELSRPAAP